MIPRLSLLLGLVCLASCNESDAPSDPSDDTAQFSGPWDYLRGTYDGNGDGRVTSAEHGRTAGSFERLVNADLHGTGREAVETYNDESALDSNNGYRSTVTATGLKRNASLGGQPLWDSSTRRYCPPAIKGMMPVTREPWCEDEKYYNRNSTRDTTMDERAGGGALGKAEDPKP